MSKNEVELAQELEDFRARWKTEVGSRRPPPSAPSPSSSSLQPSNPPQSSSNTLLSPTSNSSHLPNPLSPSKNQSNLPALSVQHELTSSSSALEIYTLAAEMEASGQLGEAVKLYQRAFRLDDNIDRVYNALKRRADLHHPPSSHTLSSVAPPSSSTSEAATFDFKTQFQTGPDFDTVAEPSFDPTAELEESFNQLGQHFVAEDETQEVLLNRLPNEVLLVVLRTLGKAGDWATIVRFGLVCKKAFLLSKEQTIWREICSLTFVPPFQIEPEQSFTSLARTFHDNDYREMFVRQPRVRLDGIYISVCHYLRSGESENSWIDTTHLITYHRLLRFFADGTCISLLSTEHPSVLVPLLTPTLRMKGLHHGFWSITPPSDSLDPSKPSLYEASGPEIQVSSLVEPDSVNETRPLKYTFQMVLRLGGPRGRWNKIELKEYKSLNLSNGEELDIRLFNQKSFFFSK
ncbi:hypothetical protein BDY24DRAFT_414023 [Mrakia frigida]|uniref:SCF ubiquitin ligase complex subunit HRT3 n=1 Tax=Mrakia frigida TaxID=29902 RepID=UPI003FCC2305